MTDHAFNAGLGAAAAERQEAARNRDAAERGDAPLLPSERLWGFWEFTYANSALAIATWAFLIGGAIGLFVGPKEGIAAIVIGNIVGVVLTALATTPLSGRYGIEQFVALRSQFGYNGSRVVYVLAVVVLTMGWLAVLAMMFGRSIDGLAALSAGEAANPTGIKMVIAAVGAILVTWFIVAKGPTSIKFFNMVVSPALVILMIVMLYLILQNRSFAELLAMPALAPPFEDDTLNFIIAVEVNLAAGFSWWPYIGNLARLTKNERTAFWPNILGIFGAAALGEIVGLLAAVALGESDPTIWMTKIAGPMIGIIALLFVAFANMTSMANILYTSIVGLRQVGTASVRAISWGAILFLFCLIPLGLVIFYPQMYDGFFIFLVWTSALNSALAGIGIADYFFLRGQKLDMRSLHGPQENGPYHFCAGFNPIGLAALAVGFVVYVMIFNPQTLASIPAFKYLTASVPSCLAAGGVHYVLTRLFARGRGWGLYP
ncbi:purine-cytosine permease family protein [Aminobacter aganoensis]|uniref:NCS1 family nucleobase:cation symporter-1 n=1 Tax=Aminobacter aganoensis TaxID=83264 RepID=A0A7X0F804_9HYPH|nr:cytosine permease [Aminobacter aganoensis]MBB6354832.1 NCS1 family nucleobase:cation symporter-1 [Aminobacter aganoensis]